MVLSRQIKGKPLKKGVLNMEQEKIREFENVRFVVKERPYTSKEGKQAVFREFVVIVSVGGRDYDFPVKSDSRKILEQMLELV